MHPTLDFNPADGFYIAAVLFGVAVVLALFQWVFDEWDKMS